ncbi:DMT family transporter [Microvirga puerhi]|uniref:DMT family transporter n=1 Tax=Microvirga puerhi TaxID=2876078 RepID=A0ABS7VR24_9HYPH|nr:DMT family transporter [Microvirga puerhi]MBZ6077664.1 DMT family transporter [Microvirga puerhi]
MSSSESAAATPLPPVTQGFLISSLLGCSILWASGFLFIKLSGDTSPFVIAAVRGLLGASSLAIFFKLQGKALLPRPEELKDWLFLGTFNGWAPNVLVSYALTQITTASAAMVQAAGPLIVAVIAHLLFADERLTRRRFLGVLVGFVGMGILIGPAAFPESGISPMGSLAMVAVTLSYATANLYVRTIKRADPSRLALGQQVCSGIPATILALIISGPGAFAVVPSHLGPLLALGIIATAVPMLMFMRMIRSAGPTRASMVGYLLPVWTALLAVLFLDEHLGARECLGGAVILSGVALVTFSGRRKPAVEA